MKKRFVTVSLFISPIIRMKSLTMLIIGCAALTCSSELFQILSKKSEKHKIQLSCGIFCVIILFHLDIELPNVLQIQLICHKFKIISHKIMHILSLSFNTFACQS